MPVWIKAIFAQQLNSECVNALILHMLEAVHTKTLFCVFVWTANLQTFITPPLDLWTPRRLLTTTTTTTTTMADYMLCSCFLQLTRLIVECESRQQFGLIIGPHKRFWFLCTRHFHHHLLVVFGFSVYCLFTARKLNAHAPSLLLHLWWISSATYRLEDELQRFESFSVDPCGRKYSWNDAEEENIVLVHVDMVLVKLGPLTSTDSRFFLYILWTYNRFILCVAWHGLCFRLGSARFRSARPRSAQLGSGQLGSARLGPGQLGPGQLGSARFRSGQLSSARVSSARLGSAQLSSARVSSARLGSARFSSGRWVLFNNSVHPFLFEIILCFLHSVPHAALHYYNTNRRWAHSSDCTDY